MRFPWLWAIVALGACKPDRPTQIVVGASTQMRVPREIATMRVVARGDTVGTLGCETRTLAGPAPASAVIALSGPDGEGVTVTAAGFAGPAPADPCSTDGALVIRRAHTRFERGESLYLPMPLRHACANVGCPDGQTCAAGGCVSAEVSSGALVTYDEALTRKDGRFCFPRADCFEDVIPAVLADPNDCTFQLPDEVPDDAKNRGFGNIEILHDDLSREVLDADPVEGFMRVPGTNDKFRLAPGLCARYRARTIASLYIGANCPPKEPLRPMCHAEPPDGGPPPEDVLCTSPAELAPTPAAVYLLVDRSSAMKDALPPLREAIDAALQAQFLRGAKVALRLLPAPAGACTASPSPFATLDGPDAVAFASAQDARGPIAAVLGDAARILPDNPPLFLDAALRADGTYQALLGQPAPIRFAVAIGNRDFVDHCTPSLGTPIQEAFVAQQDHAIKTAALLTSAPPGFNSGRDAFLDALAMARAGGAPFGDGSYDLNGLRSTVASFIAVIGASRYEIPPSIDTSGDLSHVLVSYFDVLDSVRVDVPYDPTCANGWRIEDGRVHICGKASDLLLFQVATASTYSIAHGFAPVEFAVRWAAPCK